MSGSLRQIARLACAGLPALVLSGCGLSAADNFTRGLTRDRCEGTYPICATTAGCVLGNNRYLEGSFPGTREVIVPAPAESIVTVRVFFVTQVAHGLDTRILLSEPGCIDTYEWASEGRDIFLDAGSDRTLEVTQEVFEDGDHLLEVSSDAIGDYVIQVEVIKPSG